MFFKKVKERKPITIEQMKKIDCYSLLKRMQSGQIYYFDSNWNITDSNNTIVLFNVGGMISRTVR
jgi:hypothetical protein